jgi:hypothetical protein
MLNQEQKRLCYLALSKWADSLYLEYQDINKDIIKADLGLKTIVDKNTLVKMADNRKALMADLDNLMGILDNDN